MDSINQDLDTATCYVIASLKQFIPFMDRSFIEPKLTEETTKSLKEAGLNVTAGKTPIDRGAGLDTFFEALKFLLSAHDVAGVVLLLVKLPVSMFRKYVFGKSEKQRPRMQIGLIISSKQFANQTNFYDDLSSRLSVLYCAAVAEAQRLTDAYPVYRFEVNVRVSLPESGFSADYHDTRPLSKFRQARFLRLINSLRFRPAHYLSFRMTNYGLIEHELVSPTYVLNSPYHEHDWRMINNSKKFFTFLSNAMIGGYQKKLQLMEFEEYKKKHLDTVKAQ